MKNRREFLKAGAVGLATFAILGDAMGQTNYSLELEEVTIAQLQEHLGSGKLTARRLAEMYLDRIKRIDPKTRSVIETNPDALAIADEMDRERLRGKVRSPLHGIPILIKDNIDTADRMLTTAGSLALVDAPVPKRDAHIVERLRKSGVVIIGKTNLSEWANFRGFRSISGWSGRGGQTNNPYFLDQNPCGSSSGSGVAVSANLAAVAVGTETNGSIICPAVSNGVVGIKPTLGLVSRSGIIPIAETQDTAGPMARTVTDAAILLTAMIGEDKRDAITKGAEKRWSKDFAKTLTADALRGARLGVAMQYVTDSKQKAYYQGFIEKLRDAGATLVDVTFAPDFNKLSKQRLDILKYEFKDGLNKYLAARGARYKTLEDLIKFNEQNKDKELPLFGQELFVDSQKLGPLTDAGYTEALAAMKKATREEGIDALLSQYRLDALVAPTTGQAWSIPAVAGYPSITVPVGLRDNTQSGLLFFAGAFADAKIIRYAYAFERKANGRVVPKFIDKKPTSGSN